MDTNPPFFALRIFQYIRLENTPSFFGSGGSFFKREALPSGVENQGDDWNCTGTLMRHVWIRVHYCIRVKMSRVGQGCNFKRVFSRFTNIFTDLMSSSFFSPHLFFEIPSFLVFQTKLFDWVFFFRFAFNTRFFPRDALKKTQFRPVVLFKETTTSRRDGKFSGRE